MSEKSITSTEWFRNTIKVLAIVTAIGIQSIGIIQYFKSEIQDIAITQSQIVVDKELEKRQPSINQHSDRILVLEMDKVRKDMEISQLNDVKSRLGELNDQITELEMLGQSNFRAILRERRRIDQLEEEKR